MLYRMKYLTPARSFSRDYLFDTEGDANAFIIEFNSRYSNVKIFAYEKHAPILTDAQISNIRDKSFSANDYTGVKAMYETTKGELKNCALPYNSPADLTSSKIKKLVMHMADFLKLDKATTYKKIT